MANFTVLGMPYEEYLVWKYKKLAKALEKAKPLNLKSDNS